MKRFLMLLAAMTVVGAAFAAPEGSPGDVASEKQTTPTTSAGTRAPEMKLSPGTIEFIDVDEMRIRDSSGFNWMHFYKKYRENGEPWSEAWFSSDGGFTFLLNLVNKQEKEVGVRFFKGDHPNQWCILIPSQPGYKFAIIRDALIDAFVLDEDGRLIIGRLPPNDYGPPEGRFHVRGMVDEVQALVEANGSQTENIFEVSSKGRAEKHLVVSGDGNVGIGTTSPSARLDVNGPIHQRGTALHADIAEAFSYNGELEAGDVVVIDVNDTVKVRRSREPYQTGVVGVVSSTPALMISPQSDEKTMPIAMSGRVNIKVTNENGPIKVGDLLTTSSTPGYAMKFASLEPQEGMTVRELAQIIDTNEKRRNSIVGKALQPCNTATGQIMALIQTL
ncbi:MAG: hypothetical protein HYX78_05530 [Armatimonadetes bacterium]|nr:hypothetical protein [Armatimonadota bacterium]